jgi:hypothetical protein
MDSQQKGQVLKAINDLGRRVTASDIAVKTGLPLNESRRGLNTVAEDTKATLQVSQQGQVVYCFASGFESAYINHGMIASLKIVANAVYKVAFYLLKVSFGIVLIGSFITVIVLIALVVITAMKAMSDGGDDGGGMDFGFDSFEPSDIFNFFLWQTTQQAAFNYYYNKSHPNAAQDVPEQGFLMNCYSYLFGDGDPNKKFDEQKWQVIGDLIRARQGVITAEELAPYTGANPKKEEEVLPALVRFDGSPEVTDSGNIIYVFPEMQQSAMTAQEDARQRLAKLINDDIFPKGYAEEKAWPFTIQPLDAMLPVFFFATLNFGGAYWLLQHSARIELLHPYIPLIQCLTIYGGFFIIFPLLRKLVLDVINARIELNNNKRRQNAEALAQPSVELTKKLEESVQYQTVETKISEQNLAYRSDQNILDQPDSLDQQFPQ